MSSQETKDQEVTFPGYNLWSVSLRKLRCSWHIQSRYSTVWDGESHLRVGCSQHVFYNIPKPAVIYLFYQPFVPEIDMHDCTINSPRSIKAVDKWVGTYSLTIRLPLLFPSFSSIHQTTCNQHNFNWPECTFKLDTLLTQEKTISNRFGQFTKTIHRAMKGWVNINCPSRSV